MTQKRWHVGGLTVAVGAAVAAGGCTGSDVLTTANTPITLEFVMVGDTLADFDCILFEVDDVNFRPLDGTCSAQSANPGELCLNETDCPPGTGPGACEGSLASEVIGNDGIRVVAGGSTSKGNLLGTPCVPTTTSGALCVSPFFPSVPCDQDSDCDLQIPNNRCKPKWEVQAGAQAFITPPGTLLSAGLYEINRLNVTNLTLYRDNPVYMGQCAQSVDAAAALGRPRFTVTPGTEKVIRVEVHLDAMEQFLTVPGAGSGGSSCGAVQTNITQIVSCDGCDAGIAP